VESLRENFKICHTCCDATIRGQSPSSMGESFFFPCTRHVSMYLRPGIVIHSFIHSFVLSHGVLFLLVSSAIDVATTGAVGWCSIECSYVHRTCNGYSRWVASRRCTSRWNTRRAVVSIREYLASVHATVTADGLRRDAVRVMVTADGTHAPWLRRDVHAWQNSEHALSLLYTVP
jgi:hypothetical protein